MYTSSTTENRSMISLTSAFLCVPSPSPSFRHNVGATGFCATLTSSKIASPLKRMQANDELFRIGNAYEIIHRESVSVVGRLKVRSHLAATKGKGCCKDERKRITSTACLSYTIVVDDTEIKVTQ